MNIKKTDYRMKDKQRIEYKHFLSKKRQESLVIDYTSHNLEYSDNVSEAALSHEYSAFSLLIVDET